MKSRVAIMFGAVLLTGVLFGYRGQADSETIAREVKAASRQEPPWKFSCFPLVGKDEYTQVIRGKAWIHSIVYATASRPGSTPSAIVFKLRTDPKEILGTVAEVFTVGSAGPGQIDLDILVENGLWITGSGYFTILYKPLE